MKRLIIPAICLLFVAYGVFKTYKGQTPDSAFDLDAFGKTPILLKGRIQPLDSVARNALTIISGRPTATYEDGSKRKAIEWFAEVALDPRRAFSRPVFRIYDEGLRSFLPEKEAPADVSALRALFRGRGSSHFYYSFDELRPHYERIRKEASEAGQLDAKERSRYQNAAMALANAMITQQQIAQSIHHGAYISFVDELQLLQKLATDGRLAIDKQQRGEEFDREIFNQMMAFGATYQQFERSALFFSLPRLDAQGELTWEAASYALGDIMSSGQPTEVTLQYAHIVDAYRQGDPQAFNVAVAKLHAAIAAVSPEAFGKSQAEHTFNYLNLFSTSMFFYVIVLLLGVVSWIRWADTLGQAAFWIAAGTFALHTLGIAYRMHIIGYAPVINLYSSAIFVGWVVVLFALIIELLFKNGIGNVLAGLVGFSTLILAAELGDDGDTLEMMRAVLDSNFWLATHVLTITIGYGATFVAGVVAILYILLGIFTPAVDKELKSTFRSIVYGVVCFSMLFSFVGTILGGWWADQSWGRFWGWDPKENGAILLVLWNALCLHARWGGLVRTRGFMLLAIGGNIVTSWSWMGTNLLGVGLHNYGFTSEGAKILIGFVLSQLLIIAIGFTPTKHWKSKVGNA